MTITTYYFFNFKALNLLSHNYFCLKLPLRRLLLAAMEVG